MNLERGAKRLWLVATVLWFAYAVAHFSHEIGSWGGYHWSLLSRHDSLGAALRDRERNKNVILACERAFEHVCRETDGPEALSRSSDENPYLGLMRSEKDQAVCLSSPQFLERLVFEAKALQERDAGKIKNGAACAGYAGMTVPEVNWFTVTAVLLAPLFPVLIYLLGLWIHRGFMT